MHEAIEPQIRKFNPGTLQSDEEIIRQFVVRNRELDTVLEVIRGNIDSWSCQHVLLVAPRGRGKSMLLARVAAELRTNEELSEALFPVRFMEESQEIFNAADFWLEALFHLARESATHHPELAWELRSTHEALASKWREEALADRARATVLEAADLLGKKLVLMVENMQALSENVDENFGWQLRQALQTEPQIVLLATATSRFAALDDVSQPFFEMFRILSLEPLTTKECRQLWQVVSGDEVTEHEIRPLEILTGGNPRLLVIIGAFAQHRSLRQLMEELVQLIDEHTEYFRSHLEALSKTERRVYLAVIDLWQSSSTGEIAARARMDVRTVSTMLGRLVGRGAVTVEGSGKKRHYAAAERLYCIYYKLRRERDEAAIVQHLIQFMMVFYSEDEMGKLVENLIQEAAQWPVICEGFERVRADIPQVSAIAFQEIGRALSVRDYKKLIGLTDLWLASSNTDLSPDYDGAIAQTLLIKSASHAELEQYARAIEICDEIVRRFSARNARDENFLQTMVAGAMVLKGKALEQLGESEAAMPIYDEVIKRYGENNIRLFQMLVAEALVYKGIAQCELSQLKAAIKTFDESIGRFGASDTPDIQAAVARALIYKGGIQTELGRMDEALLTFDEISRVLGVSTDDKATLLLWQAQWGRTDTLLAQEKHSAAMDTFREVYAAFDPGNEKMMRGMLNRVPALVVDGASERDLADILSSDPEKRRKLAPLVVALHQMAGESVRAPAEVLEVAADVRKVIEEGRSRPF